MQSLKWLVAAAAAFCITAQAESVITLPEGVDIEQVVVRVSVETGDVEMMAADGTFFKVASQDVEASELVQKTQFWGGGWDNCGGGCGNGCGGWDNCGGGCFNNCGGCGGFTNCGGCGGFTNCGGCGGFNNCGGGYFPPPVVVPVRPPVVVVPRGPRPVPLPYGFRGGYGYYGYR